MKKILALVLALCMVFALCACGSTAAPAASGNDAPAAGNDAPAAETEYMVAMITDYGDITDQSFNQTTYEACKAFCTDNNVPFTYFKPAGDNTADRVAMIEKAVDEGYNVIVMPGYAFGGAIVEAAPEFPDVKFIALDVGAGDILETAVANKGETYNYNPADYNIADYVDISNVYCCVYQEELCGYMAGYAAVMMGYHDLGFLGGMAVPAVVRYGYGFLQGISDAQQKLGEGAANDVAVNYVYGGQFFGDADITAAMDTWYSGGTQVVFACGGGIYTSAVDASKKYDGKVIGVDVDQAGVIATYAGDDDLSRTITSAMKGLYPATYDTLEDVIINGNWANYAGQIATLGLVSGTDPELNYVQIPMETTQWSDKFTQEDYKAMVAAMYNGEIQVSNDITKKPADFGQWMFVIDQGQIKG